MSIIYLDWETYWNRGDKYHLGKNGLSVEQYVRDPRFEVLLLSAAVDDGPVMSFEENFQDVLQALELDNPANLTFAVNMSFDGFIITDHFKIPIARPCCTRTLCRLTGVSQLTGESLTSMNTFFGTGQKKDGTEVSDGKHRRDFTEYEWAFFKTYGCDDVEQMRANIRQMLPLIDPYFLEFDSLSQNMYINPTLELDTELLLMYRQLLVAKQTESMERLQRMFNFKDREEFLKAIRSKNSKTRSFITMLESLGAQVPVKVSQTRVNRVKAAKEQLLTCTDPKLEKKLEADIAKGVHIPALAKTDQDFMAMVNHPDEDIADLCRARLENNTSMSLSRCERFLDIAARGHLPVSLAPFQAITGRFTGDNAGESKSDGTSIQNLAKRTGDTTLRYAIKAPGGKLLVAADSAQIEARVNAWVSGQDDLIEAFTEHRDVYSEFGELLFNIPAAEIRTKATSKLKWMRDVAKTGFLSYGYGASGARAAQMLLQTKVKLSEDLEEHAQIAAGHVKTYRNRFKHIRNYWKQCGDVLQRMLYASVNASPDQLSWGGPQDNVFTARSHDSIFDQSAVSVELPDGYRIYYPNLRKVMEGDEDFKKGLEPGTIVYDVWESKLSQIVTRKIYGSSLAAHTIQGLAAAVIRWQMLVINRVMPVIFQVHDEIICAVPGNKAEDALDFMLEKMKAVPDWLMPYGGATLPLSAEGNFGKSYGDV